MTINEILEGFLVKTLNMTPEAVMSTLYKLDDEGTPTKDLAEGLFDKLATLDAERVRSLKGVSNPTALQDQYKRGIKEGREVLEKALREQYGVDSTATGADLVADIVAAKASPTVTEDQVKIHPLYLTVERNAKATTDAVRAELEGKIAEIELGFKRTNTLSVVQEKALNKLSELRPVLPANQLVAQTQQKMFASQFNNYDYELDASGNILVLKDGKRVEDQHGHPVPFNDLVAQTAASMFEFQKQDPKASGGNKGTVAGENGATGAPRDEAEFKQRYAAAKTLDEKQRLVKEFKGLGG